MVMCSGLVTGLVDLLDRAAMTEALTLAVASPETAAARLTTILVKAAALLRAMGAPAREAAATALLQELQETLRRRAGAPAQKAGDGGGHPTAAQEHARQLMAGQVVLSLRCAGCPMHLSPSTHMGPTWVDLFGLSMS